jgi:membrane protein
MRQSYQSSVASILKPARRFADLLWAAWVEYQRDRANYLGLAMIYYLGISIVPLLSLLVFALGLLLRYSTVAADAQERMMATLETHFGTQLPAMIEPFFNTLERESVTGSIVSLAGLMFTASVLFHQLRLSFRAIWKYDPPLVSGSVGVVIRTTIRERAISLAMVFGGGALLVLALALAATIQWMDRILGSRLLLNQTAEWWLTTLSSFTLGIFILALLFKFLPPTPIRLRHVWLAALVCAFTWVVGTRLLALYGDFFGQNRTAYGVIGGMFAILIWIKFVSQTVFFGAELCKVSVIQAEGESAAP